MLVLQQMNSSQTIGTGNESQFMESNVLAHLTGADGKSNNSSGDQH